ncbi:hypothetical protein [Tenacibaculum sp. MAR_2009_124]|uniref:hypothetical protein n=1 Tax=Tenacibaculum sp. MAR_2009_124 TaxID=1250059 RepID=UPI000B81A8D6|nr:hypothetical protein [Tenacibaculum sp. MAR_2009_124]
MKKILEYLPFYLVVSVAIGIYLNYNIASEELKSSGVFIYASLIVFLLFLTKRVNKRGFFFIILILSFVTIGYIAAHINNPKNFNSFYKNQHLENAITTIQIKEKLKSSRFSHKYIGKIVNVDNYSTKGNVLINIDKTSSEYLKIDQVLLTKPIFKSISPL